MSPRELYVKFLGLESDIFIWNQNQEAHIASFEARHKSKNNNGLIIANAIRVRTSMKPYVIAHDPTHTS